MRLSGHPCLDCAREATASVTRADEGDVQDGSTTVYESSPAKLYTTDALLVTSNRELLTGDIERVVHRPVDTTRLSHRLCQGMGGPRSTPPPFPLLPYCLSPLSCDTLSNENAPVPFYSLPSITVEKDFGAFRLAT